MNVGKTLFAQIMEFIPWTSFSRIVQRYGGDAGVRRLTCSEQFRVMAFAQLTWRESLRDIEVTLGANASKLYAMGFRHSIHRSTLADANESRDWRIWADLAAVLIRRARKLYLDEDLGLELKNTCKPHTLPKTCLVVLLAGHTHSVLQNSAPSGLSVPIVVVELVAALPNTAVTALVQHQFAVAQRVDAGLCWLQLVS